MRRPYWPAILLPQMSGVSLPIEIPKRTLFKAAEVCDLVKVQPYVLRSWEGEFPELGVAKTAGGPRVYRRADIEQVMRIKHLLLVEGLTLAGARRRLDEEATPAGTVEDLIDPDTRDRLTEIKRGLRSILELLSTGTVDEAFTLQPPASDPPPSGSGTDQTRGGESETAPPHRTGARRKRSAPSA
jgi:DNA-binding transcriptional MerR regulator